MDALDLTEQLHELKRQRWELEETYCIASYRIEEGGRATSRSVADPVEHLRKSPQARLAAIDRQGAVVCRVHRDGDEILYEPVDG